MTEINIAQSTFERLQQHAKPFVDSPDSVVNRALDALEQKNKPHTSSPQKPGIRKIDPLILPNLKHTKVLTALVDGRSVVKPKWNPLVDRIAINAMKQLGDFNGLQKVCTANIVQGYKDDEGYRYLRQIDVSIQGQSANDACKTLVIAAQRLNIELQITFMWRNRADAAYPGEYAHLTVSKQS